MSETTTAKWALVTGATSGIGAQFARVLAGEGMSVVLVGRDRTRLTATAAEIDALGVRSETLAADLSTETGIAAVEERLRSIESPIDFLINNAGFGLKGNFTDIDVSEHERMIQTNLVALVRLTHAAATEMTKRGHGDILNVSSIAAFTPSLRPSSTYAATKAFVAAFSEGLASPFAKQGITISAVCPGWVRTAFHERAGISMGKLPGFLWLEPHEVAITALKDHRAGKSLSFPGWAYKAFMGALHFMPRRLQHSVSRFATRRHRH